MIYYHFRNRLYLCIYRNMHLNIVWQIFQFYRPTNILCFQNWGTISLRSKYTRKTNAPPYTFLSAQKSAQIHQSINESIKNTYLHVPWGCPKNTIFNLVHIKSRLNDQEVKEVIKKSEKPRHRPCYRTEKQVFFFSFLLHKFPPQFLLLYLG